jgi:hypothetical protein
MEGKDRKLVDMEHLLPLCHPDEGGIYGWNRRESCYLLAVDREVLVRSDLMKWNLSLAPGDCFVVPPRNDEENIEQGTRNVECRIKEEWGI